MQTIFLKVKNVTAKNMVFMALLFLLSTTLLSGQNSRFLKTDGTLIRNNNGTGDIVYLRGTNIGGWLIQEPWMTPFGEDQSSYNGDEEKIRQILTRRFGETGQDALYQVFQDTWFTEDDVKTCADLGMTVLRLPIYWRNLMNSDWSWKADPWKRIDWLVNTAEKYGIYVILDFHGLPGSQNGEHHSGKIGTADLWTNPFYMDKTEEIWVAMAARYKDHPNVAGYDLFNEPGQTTNQIEWDFADRLYDAIRAVDPDHIIIIESTWDWGDMPNPKEYSWENVVYEFHYYCWGGDDDYNKQVAFTNSKVAEAKNYAHYDVPIFVGEFNGFFLESVWRYNMKTFNAQGWHWTSWAYKGTSKWDNWGLYNIYDPPRADLDNDSFETLLANYGSWTTDRFTENTWLVEAMKDSLTGDVKGADYPVPGIVEAENFYDQYGVQTEECNEGGYNVGWIDSGDWMRYYVNVETSGVYTVEFRVASNDGEGKIELSDGTRALATVEVPNTGWWQNWTTVLAEVYLYAGQQTLIVNALNRGFNINKMNFKKTGDTKVTVKLINKAAYNKAMDIAAGSTENGANIQVSDYKGGDNQQWILTEVEEGYFKIVSKHSVKGLNIDFWSTENGGNIQQWTYGGGDNELWQIIELSNGYYMLRSKFNGKYLQIQSSVEGANVEQWEYTGSDMQKWQIVFLP